MSARRKPGRAATAERFVSRLREALSRFADGVHTLAEPASPAQLDAAEARLGLRLPASLREVYAFSDGLWLFDDVVRVLPLAELAARAGRLRCGQAEGGAILVDTEGRVFEEDEAGDLVCSAPSLEDELLARIAREALLIDAEGEWKEVFGDDGELLPAVRRRRTDAARRRVPESARWRVEAAELALELDGDEAAAETELEAAVLADPAAAAPRELLGLLQVSRGALEEGARSLIAAAEHSAPERRSERAATAAEAAQRAGLEDERARLSKLAIEAEPAIVERLIAEAEAAMSEGRLEDADRRAAQARALDANALPPRLRLRAQLRPLR